MGLQGWEEPPRGRDAGTGPTELLLNTGGMYGLDANEANTSWVPGSKEKGTILPSREAWVPETCKAAAFSEGLDLWRKGPAH